MEEMKWKCPFCLIELKLDANRHAICLKCGFESGCYGNFGYIRNCYRCTDKDRCRAYTKVLGRKGSFNPSRRKNLILYGEKVA